MSAYLYTQDYADRMTARVIDLQNKVNELEASLAEQDEFARAIATEFYYHWHNAPGTNTQQGFQDWWELNRVRFLPPKPEKTDV